MAAASWAATRAADDDPPPHHRRPHRRGPYPEAGRAVASATSGQSAGL